MIYANEWSGKSKKVSGIHFQHLRIREIEPTQLERRPFFAAAPLVSQGFEKREKWVVRGQDTPIIKYDTCLHYFSLPLTGETKGTKGRERLEGGVASSGTAVCAVGDCNADGSAMVVRAELGGARGS